MPVEIIDENPEPESTVEIVEPEEKKSTVEIVDEAPDRQPRDPIGTVNLMDEGEEDAEPLEEGLLANPPKAVEEVVTEYTTVGPQALALIAQVADYVPSLVRGARRNASKLIEGAIGERAGEALRGLASFTPASALFGKNDKLDEWLKISEDFRNDTKAYNIESAFEQGGVVGAGVAMGVDSAEQVLLNLSLFKAINAGYGSAATGNASKWAKSAATIKKALIRTTIMTGTREQDSLKGAAWSFAVSMMYQSTPALSGWMGSNIGAVAADIALNLAISRGQVDEVIQAGIDQANAENKPDRGMLYATLALVEMFTGDVVFGSMTRTFRAGNAPSSVQEGVRDVVARSSKAVAALPRAEATGDIARFEKGEGSVAEVQAWLNEQGNGSWKIHRFEPGKPEVVPEGASPIPFDMRPQGYSGVVRGYAVKDAVFGGRAGKMLLASEVALRPEQQAARDEAARVAGGETRQLLSEAGKQAEEPPVATPVAPPTTVDEYTMKGYHVTRAEPFDAFRDDVEIPSSEGTYFWPTREAAEKVAGPRERIVEVDIKPGRQASPDQMGNFRRGEMSGEFDTAVGEGMFGPEIAVFNMDNIRIAGDEGAPSAVAEGVPVTPPAVRPVVTQARANMSDIMDTIPKSTVARGRTKAAGKGRKDISMRIEDQVGKVLNAVERQDVKPPVAGEPIEPIEDAFAKSVDKAIKDISAPMTDKAFRHRLFNTRAATQDQLDAVAVRLHPELAGTEAPRRELNISELRAEFPHIDRSRLRDAGMVKDIILTAHNAGSPAEALRELNELSMIKKRPLITDAASVARGGEPIVEKPQYAATPQERTDIMASMPKSLKTTPQGTEAMEKVIGQMDRPLSEDGKSRRMEIHLLSKLAYNANKYGNRGQADEAADYRNLVSRAANLESMRYVFADIATRSSDPTIFSNYRDVDLSVRQATTRVERRLEAIFEKASSVDVQVGKKVKPMSAKRYAQSNPEVSNAIKVLISVPEAKNAESPNAVRRAEATKILDDIKDPKHRKQMYALKDSLNNALQTTSANDVRRLQVYRFGDLWNKTDDSGKTWGEKYIDMRDRGASRTPNMEQSFGRMQGMLEQVLPKFNDDGKVGIVPVESLIEIDRGYNEKVVAEGRKAADAWIIDRLDKESWGTRKAYMMTERDREDFQLIPQIRETPGFSKKMAEETVKATGEINQRTGLSDTNSGDVITLVFDHMKKLAAQADTYHQANDLRSSIGKLHNDGRMPDSVYEGVDRWITSQWGKYSNPNLLTKWAMMANAAFWTAYPVALTRIAWYSGRNLMYQGAPWGPLSTQFRPGDVLMNYPRLLKHMTDKTSSVYRWYKKNFRANISQADAIFYEQSLMQDPSSASVVGRVGNQAMQTAWRWSATAIGMSDQVNRIIGLTGYMIADKHVDAFIKSRDSSVTRRTASGEETTRIGRVVTKADVLHRVKAETMHPEQQRVLFELFDKAKDTPKDSPEWEQFKGTLTEWKEENINFVYRIGGKSPLEQNPDLRPRIGLIAYQRGTGEELVRNGFAPILDAGKMVKAGQPLSAEQFRDLNSGAQVLGKSVIAHALSSAIAGYILGEKRDEWSSKEGKTRPTYSMVHSLMWRLDTPGQGIITKLFESGAMFFYSLATGDAKKNKKARNYLANQGLYFVPLLSFIRTLFESSGNKEGVSNVEFLMGELGDSMLTYRKRIEKWSHAVFDTANEHDQRWDMGAGAQFLKRTLDSETVHQIPKNTFKVLFGGDE